MPKFRKLWTKTLDSFDFNEMPDEFTRVVWLLLPLILDGEGRGIDLPAWVCSRMFPLRRVDEADVVRAFEFFESRGMIVRYKVESRSYFYCVNWTTYQSGTEKEAASVLPAPPDKLPTNSGLDQEKVGRRSTFSASASASVNESVNASESKTPQQFSSDWIIRVFSKVTGMVSIPGNETDKVLPAIEGLYYQHNRDESALIAFLKPYYEKWLTTKGKNGQPYKRTNCAWLYEWAVAGEMPEQFQSDTALAEAQMKLYGRAG